MSRWLGQATSVLVDAAKATAVVSVIVLLAGPFAVQYGFFARRSPAEIGQKG